jgi:hypothetical protein
MGETNDRGLEVETGGVERCCKYRKSKRKGWLRRTQWLRANDEKDCHNLQQEAIDKMVDTIPPAEGHTKEECKA